MVGFGGKAVMRRLRVVMLALISALVASPALATPLNAPVGYDADYASESAFLTLHHGDTGTFQVLFVNTGTVSWVRGSGTEVGLSICVDTPAPQHLRCNVLSPYADWAVNWVSPRLYAGTTQSVTSPGLLATFVFSVKVPIDAPAGDYYFRGEVVQLATGTVLHPVGYYALVTVQ